MSTRKRARRRRSRLKAQAKKTFVEGATWAWGEMRLYSTSYDTFASVATPERLLPTAPYHASVLHGARRFVKGRSVKEKGLRVHDARGYCLLTVMPCHNTPQLKEALINLCLARDWTANG